MKVMASVRLGLNSNHHGEYVHDLVGAAKSFGIKASHYDANDNCFWLDLPEDAEEEWTSSEDVIVTLNDGRKFYCWVEAIEE